MRSRRSSVILCTRRSFTDAINDAGNCDCDSSTVTSSVLDMHAIRRSLSVSLRPGSCARDGMVASLHEVYEVASYITNACLHELRVQ